MNKELIKRYKAEFDHWLNGGKILSKYTLLPTWTDCQSEDIWRIPDKDISKVLITIDDEYVEYRKALAEGKTIQYYVDSFVGWQDVKSLNQPCTDPDSFRIKPDVHKFKVGDWVRDGDNIYQFIEPSSDYSHQESLKRCTLWQPKDGEWCIMYDTDEDPNANSITIQRWNNKSKWKPIPYLGKLPPYIKK